MPYGLDKADFSNLYSSVVIVRFGHNNGLCGFDWSRWIYPVLSNMPLFLLHCGLCCTTYIFVCRKFEL